MVPDLRARDRPSRPQEQRARGMVARTRIRRCVCGLPERCLSMTTELLVRTLVESLTSWQTILLFMMAVVDFLAGAGVALLKDHKFKLELVGEWVYNNLFSKGLLFALVST